MGNIGTRVEITRTTITETKPRNQDSWAVSSNEPLNFSSNTDTKTTNEEKQKHYLTVGNMKFPLFTSTHTKEIIEENKDVTINHSDNSENSN